MTKTEHILEYFHEATPEELAQGRCWYKNAHGVAMEVMAMSHSGLEIQGWTLSQSAAVIAALSPSNRWDRNVLDAYAMAGWSAGARDLPPPKVCTYNANKLKALEIGGAVNDSSRDYSEMLKGRKTRSFARLIERPGLPGTVVIDRHAVRAYLGDGAGEIPSVSERLYEKAEYAYIKAADEVYERDGDSISPAEMQAVVWLAFKRYHNV